MRLASPIRSKILSYNPKSIGNRMRRILFVALLIAVLSACTQDLTVDQPLQSEDLIYASIGAEESRAQLNSSQQSVWNANDQIVIHSPTKAMLYKFKGKSGDREGSFQSAGTFNFSNFASYGFKKYYALYPYENWAGVGSFNDGSPAIFFTVPAEQTYTEGSYGIHANTMFATSDNGSRYTFMNLMGYIRVSIKGKKSIASIELQGSNSETLAGTMYISPDTPFSPAWYSGGGDLSSKITIKCASDIQLSDKAVDFYFALPPMTLSKGLVINICYTDGTSYAKNTGKSITIERNAILPFTAFTAKDSNDWQTAVIYHTGAEIIAPAVLGEAVLGTINWGDGATSVIGELTKRYYTDDKNSHTITIETLNSTGIQLQSCEGVSKIDLSQF